MISEPAIAVTRHRFPTAAPDGLLAAFLLSVLATAGLFYVNIMAALVSGLIDGLHFTQKDAGFVASANVYGAALGALTAVFLVKRISWRPTAVVALIVLIAIDIVSTMIVTRGLLIPVRFLHGCVGGFLVGVSYSVIARTKTPDRVFGMLLVVQYGLGGLGVMFLPRLVPLFGTPILFAALIALSVITLMLIPFISDYPRRSITSDEAAKTRTQWKPLIVVLIGMFFFQAGNMALAAYMIEIGRAYGHSLDFISPALGVATWFGILGAFLVVLLGTRFGRFRPLLFGLIFNVVVNAAFYFGGQWEIFAGANIGGAIGWGFTIPYLFGLASAFDTTGQSAALAGFFSKMGLATGPLLGGLILAGASPELLITVALVALALSCAAAVPAAMVDGRRPNN